MRRFFAVLIAGLACTALVAAPASASIFSDAISNDGIKDTLQDNSVSLALFDNGDDVISVGDVIAGILKWNTNTADGNSVADHAITVFSATILTGPTDNGKNLDTPGLTGDVTSDLLEFTLGATPSDGNPFNGMGIAEMLPTLDAIYSFSDSTVGVTLSNVGGLDPTTQPFFPTALGLIDASYTLDFSFGLLGDDFFEAALADANGGNGDYGANDGSEPGISAYNTPGVISLLDADNDGYLDEYDNQAGGSAGPGTFFQNLQTGKEAAGFSIFINNLAPVNPVLVHKLDGSIESVDVALTRSTTLVQPTPTQVGNGYAFANQAFMDINTVPEPASILVWGLILGMAGSYGVWRRRK